MDEDATIAELKREVEEFRDERAWRKYHKPKDLAISITIEATELLEIFQWENLEEREILSDNERLGRIQEELADVFLYCLCLASILKLDVSSSLRRKLEANRERYPVDEYYGKAK
ncbi:MAG: nucleotide pyrophosphohydrolase [Candidatus Hydrothermarchaeales archaeon]